MTLDRFTSMGISNDAEEFLEGARLLRAQKSVTYAPMYFLACQSIELSFKAYLRGCGYSDGDLRKIGHDLERCTQAAVDAGVEQHVRLSDDDIVAITLANPHYRSRDFQYSRTGFKRWPHIDALVDFAQRLWDGLRAFCIANREHHFGKPTAIV